MSTNGSIRVLLVDDHHVFRSGLRLVLEEFDEFELVGDFESAEAALPAIERRRPDVVLMDLNMPGMSGIEATRQARERVPDVQVVVLTVSGVEDDVIDALEAGAAGYLLKEAVGEELSRAIKAAHRGGSALSPTVARMVVERSRRTATGAPDREAVETLSEREQDVLRLLADGRDNAEIAAELFLSPATVKRDVSALMAKLGAGNRVQAAIKAVRAGLI